MCKSTRILITYAAAAIIAGLCGGYLLYALFSWQPPPNTLAEQLRPVAFCVVALWLLSLLSQMLMDPLGWRVVRMLRRREASGFLAN